jgi:hypothetical protein
MRLRERMMRVAASRRVTICMMTCLVWGEGKRIV